MWQKLKNDHILAYSSVKSDSSMGPKAQSLDYKIYGLHPKSCQFSLKKISEYERYQDFIDFVKKSDYNETTQMVFFEFSSILLPFDMLLSFTLPRIDKPGHYQFTFEKGFLRGLVGAIEVSEENQRCLFKGSARWHGSHSEIPDTIFEVFSKNLGKAAMERIFRFSSKL
jgi:hypothetical protein